MHDNTSTGLSERENYGLIIIILLALVCTLKWTEAKAEDEYSQALIKGLYDYARMDGVETLLEPLHNSLSVNELEVLGQEYGLLQSSVSGPEYEGDKSVYVKEYMEHYKQMEFMWYKRAAEKGSECGAWHVRHYEGDKYLSNLVGATYQRSNALLGSAPCKYEELPFIEEVVCKHTQTAYWCNMAAMAPEIRKTNHEMKERVELKRKKD